MLTLGILSNKPLLVQQIEKYLEVENKLVSVETEKHLTQIDGLVISIESNEQLGFVVDWLLMCKKIPELFVWVYSSTHLQFEMEILLALGANGVVMKKEKNLLYLIENMFNKLHYSIEQKKSHLIVKENSRTVLVNRIEKELTSIEFKLFRLLYSNLNNTVLYDSLIRKIWSNSSSNKLVPIQNIAFRLRTKLKNSKEFELKTIRSIGYMLKIKE